MLENNIEWWETNFARFRISFARIVDLMEQQVHNMQEYHNEICELNKKLKHAIDDLEKKVC